MVTLTEDISLRTWVLEHITFAWHRLREQRGRLLSHFLLCSKVYSVLKTSVVPLLGDEYQLYQRDWKSSPKFNRVTKIIMRLAGSKKE